VNRSTLHPRIGAETDSRGITGTKKPFLASPTDSLTLFAIRYMAGEDPTNVHRPGVERMVDISDARARLNAETTIGEY
jgi:hypothetical protein